jgi:MFS family permease
MPDRAPTGPWAALRFRDFRLFWISLLISSIGSWMQMTAISWLLYDLTHSAFQLGLNGLFRAVPWIALGLLGGTLADRYDRKRLILFTQTTLMLLAFLLGFLIQTGWIRVWHIYLYTALTGIVGTLDGPARHALFPTLVPRSLLANAIALNSLQWRGTALIGPSLAGIAIVTVGMTGAFYAKGVSFLAVVVSLLCIRTSFQGAGRSHEFFRDLREGVAFTMSQEVILGVIVMEAALSLLGLNSALLTIFARDVLHVGASGLGFLQSARGLGGILGSALLVSMNQTPQQGRILFWSALLCGTSFVLFALSRSFPLSLLVLLIAGATDTVWGATRNTLVQLKTPDAMKGRAMSIFQLCSHGFTPLGQVEIGIAVSLVGARQATFLNGMLVTLITLLTTWRVPGISRFRWSNEEPKTVAGTEEEILAK